MSWDAITGIGTIGDACVGLYTIACSCSATKVGRRITWHCRLCKLLSIA